jgi:hypothetical protein
MKPFALVALVLLAPIASVGCASASDSEDSTPAANDSALSSSSDTCVAAARGAAEEEYGDAPDGTKVQTLIKGQKYRVTVGINNPESGPADFYVVFPNGCSSKPTVSDVPELPHPLRDAMQRVYNGILRDHGNELPSGFEIAPSSLPSSAHRQYKTWTAGGPSLCSKVDAYQIKVSGQPTFAVTCDPAHDSIKTHVAIYDAEGGDIDQLAIYFSNDVGQDGRSWQNETFLQKD